jgi:hypothetical protein
MALFKNALFGGALFAGALLHGNAEAALLGGGVPLKRPSHANPAYWHWTGERFIYADTVEAIQQAITASPNAPVLLVGQAKIRLPKPPKQQALMPTYMAKAVAIADTKRDELKAKQEQDEIALILLTLGITESDQLLVVY